jgi:ABC-type transporter Mla subunit MlaD
MRSHSVAFFAIALAFGALFSQAPEFMNQYHQRIGGAIDELQRITDQFNENARKLGYDRGSALGTMSNDPKPLIQGLARLENENAERLARLKQQQADLANARAIDRFLTIHL